MDIQSARKAVDAQQFKLLVDAVSDYAIFLLDPDGNIASWNSGAERIKGYEADDIIGTHFSVFYTAEDLAQNKPSDELKTATLLGRCEDEGWRIRKDGSRFWANVVITALTDDSGRSLGFAKVTRDLTQRKRQEEQLRLSHDQLEERVIARTLELSALTEKLGRSEARCRAIIDALSVMVWSSDGTGNQRNSTPPWHIFTGQTEEVARGWGWIKAMPEGDQNRVERLFRNGFNDVKAFDVECRVRRADGILRNFAIYAAPVLSESGQLTEWTGVCMDITERKNLEEQVRQSQKMQAIGQLASGIAHDFNNYLTVISGYIAMLRDEIPPDLPQTASIFAISDAAEKAARLTRQLLLFSRQSIVEREAVDVNAIINNTEFLLRRLIGENVQLTILLDPDAKPVYADIAQLEQVIINLAVNARDAMAEGGELTIATKNVELDEAYVNTHVEVEAGRHTLITVSDNGIGMTPDVRSRIFEPFFTTKQPGKGTGLGLSVVHGIVKQWNGKIGAYSESGLGTTIKIYFPAIEVEVVHKVEIMGPAIIGSANETILLVEDEDAVRSFAALVLRKCGYNVLLAANAEEAVEVARAMDGKLNLLITDVVLPAMSGPKLAQKLLARNPHIGVLYSSGYTDDAVVRHGILNAEVAFLQKPYTPTALLRKTREVLDCLSKSGNSDA